MSVAWRLGSTWYHHLLVAAVRSGVAEPLPDAQGRLILPSAVRYHAERAEVGESARAAAAEDPFNTVISVKRLMGAAWRTSSNWASNCPTASARASRTCPSSRPYRG